MITCNICSKNFLYWLNYHKHLRAHKFRHETFYCVFMGCTDNFKNYSSYVSHVYRNHKNTNHSVNRAIESKNTINKQFSCNQCYKPFKNYVHLIKHVILHLKSDSYLICPINNCHIRFINESSYRSHLKRNHNFYFKCKGLHNARQTEPQTQYFEPDNMLTNITLNNSSNIEHNVNINKSDDACASTVIDQTDHVKLNLQHELAFLFHTLKYVHNIPKKVIQLITENINKIHSNCTNEILSEIDNISQKFSLPQAVENSLKHSVSKTLCLDSMNLGSDYRREKVFNEYFQFITPQKIYLGKNDMNNDCYYYYVPILNSLEKLLQEEEIYNQVCNKSFEIKIGPIGSFEDYRDGLTYKNNVFLNEEPRLEIILYADAFEIVNPLGSAKKKYKTLGVYYTLGNIVSYERLKTKNMQLAILCFNSHINTFSLDVILEKLIEDIIILENSGIFIPKNGTFLKGTIFIILGDNLGSHQLGGYMENFSTAEHFCRYCLITKSEFKLCIHSFGEKRSPENYKIAIEKVQHDGKPFNGIKRDSPFNKCKFFHVAQPGLPPCIAHDIYEGFLAYDLILFIKYFVSENWFTFQSLNKNIFSIQKKLKFSTAYPLLNNKQNKLPGHAIQNYEFCVMFPLTIYFMSKSSTNIDFENPVWKLFICLLEIVQICSSQQITFDQINYLQHISIFYVTELKNLFIEYNLRPKHHFFLHYPDLIKEFGPLVKHSTMRFESKHQFFKVIARTVNNFTNILHTLTMRHQHFQSSLFNKRFDQTSVIAFKKKIISREFQKVLDFEYRFQSFKVKYRNVEYNKNQFVAVQRDEESKVILLQIKHIFINKNLSEIIFHGDIFKMEYDSQHGLYVIIKTNPENSFVPFQSLLNPFPFMATSISDETITSLKQIIHF